MEFERHSWVGLDLPLGLELIKRFYSQRKFGVAVTALAWLLYVMSFFYSSDGNIKRTHSSDADDELKDDETTGGSWLLTLVVTLVTGPFLIIHFVNRNGRQMVTSGYIEIKDDPARLQSEDVASENKNEDEPFEDNSLQQHLQIRMTELVTVANDLDSSTVTQESTVQNEDSSPTCPSFPCNLTDGISKCPDRADMSVQTTEMLSLATEDTAAITDVPLRESKAVNTSHQLLIPTKSVGTETTGPYKKKLRRAQKLFSEAVDKAKEEKRAKLEKWRHVITKYRDKLMKLTKATEEKCTLMAYVRTSNQASEKDIQGEAVALSDLKWKLQYQCKLNEKFSEDLKNKRAIVNSLSQIIKPEGEK